jgi:hypothetical protein
MPTKSLPTKSQRKVKPQVTVKAGTEKASSWRDHPIAIGAVVALATGGLEEAR